MSFDKKEVALILGGKIRVLRQNKGLTIEQLAHESGMGYIQLSRIELGKINTTVYQVFKISKSLEVEVSEIFDNTL